MRQTYCVLLGLLLALALYLIMSVVFGLFGYANWFDMSRLGYDITHYLIVAIATFYAAKKAGSKGWLIGAVLGLLMAALSLLFNWSLKELAVTTLVRSAITLAVATIAGAIGVNI